MLFRGQVTICDQRPPIESKGLAKGGTAAPCFAWSSASTEKERATSFLFHLIPSFMVYYFWMITFEFVQTQKNIPLSKYDHHSKSFFHG
jgi:hypothetical protein